MTRKEAQAFSSLRNHTPIRAETSSGPARIVVCFLRLLKHRKMYSEIDCE